jgi:hypothetical protein
LNRNLPFICAANETRTQALSALSAVGT